MGSISSWLFKHQYSWTLGIEIHHLSLLLSKSFPTPKELIKFIYSCQNFVGFITPYYLCSLLLEKIYCTITNGIIQSSEENTRCPKSRSWKKFLFNSTIILNLINYFFPLMASSSSFYFNGQTSEILLRSIIFA